MNENKEAEKLAQWLNLQWYLFSHIANESWLPPKIAMLSAIRKKRMWLKPWFPDYMIILKRWSLLFIELKKSRTKKQNWELKALSSDWIHISDEQKYWISELNKIDNIQANICFGCNEAIETIKSIET